MLKRIKNCMQRGVELLPDSSEVKIRRLKLDLTQTDLAKKAGVGQSIVAKIEKGRVDASYSHLKMIFDCLEELESKTDATANMVMNEKIFLVSRHDRVSRAIELMRKHGFSQLPVFEGKHPVGSISEKSIIEKFSSGLNAKHLGTLECGEIMDESFPIVPENTPLPAVSELLKHHFAVLVRRKEAVVGIITKADLLKTIRRV